MCPRNIEAFTENKILLHLSVNNFFISLSSWVLYVCSRKIVQRTSYHVVLIDIHDHSLVTCNIIYLHSIAQFLHYLV